MNPITIPNISIPTIGIPTIGIPSVGFPSASGGGGLEWPAGMKEHIKAWYDPKKQGLTNFDVIESYTEDFTTWRYLDSRGIATITGSTIHITEAKSIQGIVEDNKEPYSDIKILVQGVTADNPLNVRDINGTKAVIDKDGVYEFKDNGLYFGFGFSKVGVVDVTITQLPTSILKDLSGNGNHAYLYGGKGKLNSGIGLYTYDYNSDRWSSTGRADYIITKKGFEFTNIIEDGGIIFALGSNIAKEGDKVKVKISGIPNGGRVYFGTWITATEDGEYLGTYAYDNNGNTTIGTLGCIGATITLEFIPDYPDQLCYDGKMYAVCYGFPILEDYTIMADRTWFKNVGCFAGKRSASDNKGAFVFENNSSNGFVCYNYGGVNNINRVDNKITYQTIHDYNGQAINRANSVDTDFLLIGGGLYRPTTNSFDEFWQGCHGKIIIADRSLTEDEITWLKNNLFTIEIPTPAYDFDFSKLKSGENTFTDKYGNELSLYNFQWAGMSGKDGYIEDFAVWGKNTERYTGSITNKTINITEVSKANSICVYTSPKKQNIKLYITGLITGQNIILGNADVPSTVGNIIVSENGLYDIDESQFNQYFGIGFGFTGDCNITITQLPLYPNALVFDGVDDYCKLPKMTIKSVILDVVPLYIGNDMLYDCRTGGDMNAFGIYNEADIVAYSARNDGKTYINGELNTTLTALDIGINRQIVCVTNDNAVEHEQFIGSSISVNSVAKMALYRITGFTEVLTPDQVWKWYQKNKPKGGDK